MSRTLLLAQQPPAALPVRAGAFSRPKVTRGWWSLCSPYSLVEPRRLFPRLLFVSFSEQRVSVDKQFLTCSLTRVQLNSSA